MSTTDNAIITRILTDAIDRQISDIHLTAGSQPVVRHDGKLETMVEEQVMSAEFLQELLQFFLPEDKQAILAQQKLVTVGYNLGNRARFRVSVSYQKGYPEFDLRYIPMQAPAAVTLGLPKQLFGLVSEVEGLILISGPLGSGRTTTLTSLIDYINHTSAKHIVMMSDPIEYVLVNDKSLIEQRDIGDDVPNLTEALQALKYEDVDVVALDVPLPLSIWPEILNLASAGTLVLAIVEADTTVRALEHLNSSWPGVDSGNIRLLLAEVFLAASAQRLLPRLGGGRILATEILLGTQPVRSLLHEGKIPQLQTVLETSREEGMHSLERSLANLVTTGDVMREEALAQSTHRESLESLLRPKT